LKIDAEPFLVSQIKIFLKMFLQLKMLPLSQKYILKNTFSKNITKNLSAKNINLTMYNNFIQ